MKTVKLAHVCQIRVRYAETDKMGIVYNGNYLTFFEVARTELMRHHGLPYSKFEAKGYYLPLIDAYVNYQKPAYYDDVLNIKGYFEWSGEPKLKFNYEVFVNNNLITSGYTSHAFFNAETKMPVKPPKFFIETVLNAYKEE